jgi:hypothetical protein
MHSTAAAAEHTQGGPYKDIGPELLAQVNRPPSNTQACNAVLPKQYQHAAAANASGASPIH